MKHRLRFALLCLLMLGSALFVFPQEAEHHGVVTGTVIDDSTGLPINEVSVGFFRSTGLWVQRVHTDTTGAYSAELDTGRYLIRFERFPYVPEWFDNVYEVHDAFVADVHADTSIIANAGLQPLPRPQPVTVSGTVTDSVTGQPLPNTFVAFLRPHRELRELEHELEQFGGFDNERFTLPGFGRLFGVVWFGFTNDAGQYQAHLLKGLRYVAFAFKPGFVHQFYQKKLTPFDADQLTFNGDTSGIDFPLIPNPFAANSFSGRVADTTGVGVPSHVVLIRVTPLGWIPVRYQVTDSAGNYMFQHLVNGRFLVHAIPVSGFAPAWYKEGACGVRNWHNADVVDVSSNVTGIDVCVKPLDESGFCHIDGHITSGGGNTFASAATNEAVAVSAVSTTTGEVAGYDVTGADGSYSLDNLPAGSYTIVVDKEGFTASNAPTVTVDESGGFLSSGNVIGVTGDTPLGVDEHQNQSPASFMLRQNYPNPFNPTTEIHFDVAKAGNVAIRIYNIMGQEIARLVDQRLDIGSYVARWNGNDARGLQVSSGLYFYRMDADNFHDLKKMILMK
ncbi:MAG TPA: carboxypeptidase regulatory-like domain-containing protein [Bacteroidota bacterium]|nr:carboxypeptidase regulatory-like domain-containing protein [Bacteroidota bacterium]